MLYTKTENGQWSKKLTLQNFRRLQIAKARNEVIFRALIDLKQPKLLFFFFTFIFRMSKYYSSYKRVYVKRVFHRFIEGTSQASGVVWYFQYDLVAFKLPFDFHCLWTSHTEKVNMEPRVGLAACMLTKDRINMFNYGQHCHVFSRWLVFPRLATLFDPLHNDLSSVSFQRLCCYQVF